ncbi:MAG TPA: flagellar basal body P-ring protein FlgI, partial [Burkholderiaceae bacterium]
MNRAYMNHMLLKVLGGAACFALLAGQALAGEGDTARLKDLGKFAGWRENALVGYGLVSGLAGTGDSVSN